jgi:hypothetical protein
VTAAAHSDAGLYGKLAIVAQRAPARRRGNQAGAGRQPTARTETTVQTPRAAAYPERRQRQKRPESTDMPTSHWHKLYTSQVAAPPGVLFELLADMPNYGRWLPGS